MLASKPLANSGKYYVVNKDTTSNGAPLAISFNGFDTQLTVTEFEGLITQEVRHDLTSLIAVAEILTVTYISGTSKSFWVPSFIGSLLWTFRESLPIPGTIEPSWPRMEF